MREKLRSGSRESHHKDFPFGINGHCGVTIPEPRGSGGACNILIAPDCNNSFNFMNAIDAQLMHKYFLLITLFLSSNTLYVNGGHGTGLTPDTLTMVCFSKFSSMSRGNGCAQITHLRGFCGFRFFAIAFLSRQRINVVQFPVRDKIREPVVPVFVRPKIIVLRINPVHPTGDINVR